MVTLNDILSILRSYVDSHHQLNSFGFGPTTNISTTNKLMSMLWLNPVPSQSVGHRYIQRFELYILDIMDQDLSNLESVLNDAELIGHDLISYFYQDDFDNDFELNEESVIFTPYINKHDDLLAGYVIDIEFYKDIDLNYCKTPIN